MTAYIVPVIFIAVFICGIITRSDPYSAFVRGASQALDLIKTVFPYLLAVMIAVRLMQSCGISKWLSEILAPVLSKIGLPSELIELILIRPLSGAGALGILNNIYDTYGPDSFIGNCASVIYGSSETVFYLSSIYFSKCKVKGLGKGIAAGLFANVCGYVTGCYILRLLMP